MQRIGRGPRVSRRGFLTATAAAGAVALTSSATGQPARADQTLLSDAQATEPFYGAHQSGVETPLQAHSVFIGLKLNPGSTRDDLVRLMRIWTDDGARLTQGEPALADTEPELATVPSRLTATIGFGPDVFAIKGLPDQRPEWLAELPDFPIDKLRPEYTGGDVLLHLGSDDPITLAHAQRMMVKDSAPFAAVHWSQRGFHRATANTRPGQTARNLMGQIDGTVNPEPGTPEFASNVWIDQAPPQWLRGGTGMVLRRIQMEMAGWDAMSRTEKELVIGRRLSNGAPLTGDREQDAPDFTAVDDSGMPVIPEFAHIRLAHDATPSMILRRPFNYDDGFLADGTPDLGLLFAAYAADISEQYLPMQEKLAEEDVFNTWTTPVGSAVFAIPPGCQPGGFIGETLLA